MNLNSNIISLVFLNFKLYIISTNIYRGKKKYYLLFNPNTGSHMLVYIHNNSDCI